MVSLGALVHNFMNKEPSSPSPEKRNGAIFPADFNVFSTASCNEKDAATQEIAARYCKKLTIIVPHCESFSSCISNNSPASSEGATLVGSDKYSEFITLFEEDKGPQLRHNPACEQILADARKETISKMNKCGASQRESLVCPRIGCRDTLRNARGLKMHLALHDISNKVNGLAFDCHGCEALFETKQARKMHHCHDPPMDLASPPESPTVAIFKRLLSPFTANFS
ncbi:hypothetical protein CPB85DRAFT_1442429 [Mucidula mucida]|nr:hypothetical protein CPB85DRAFT_1442429 [Mucidula mucida]